MRDSLRAVALRRIEQLTGVRPAAVGLPQPGQHPRQFGDAVIIIEATHPAGLVPPAAVDDATGGRVGGGVSIGSDEMIFGFANG